MHRFALLFLMMLAAVLPAATPTPAAPEVVVKIASTAGSQMDVWLNGRRIGFTPVEKRLPAGRYWLTASAESIMPLMQAIDVRPSPHPYQGILLPAVPVTQENYREVGQWVLSEIPKQRGNPHLVLMALQLTRDPAESAKLLEVADKALPGDPMADVLRAQAVGRSGRLADALVAADRAVAAANYVAAAWRVRADVLRALGRPEEALDSANRAVTLDPFDFRNLEMRARVHAAAGRAREQKADEDRGAELYNALHESAERRRAGS